MDLFLQAPLPLSHVKKMQELYDLNACMNSEIRCRYTSNKNLSFWKPPCDWMSSLQVAEVVCSFQVGGSGSDGTEDGDRTGQDEVHAAALQVIFPEFSAHFTSLTFHCKPADSLHFQRSVQL